MAINNTLNKGLVSPFRIGGNKSVSPFNIGGSKTTSPKIFTGSPAPSSSTTVGMSTPSGPKRVPLITPPKTAGLASAFLPRAKSASLAAKTTTPALYNPNDPLQMKPGETPDQYSARVATLQSGATAVPVAGTSVNTAEPPATTFPGLVGTLARATQGTDPNVANAQVALAEAVKRQQELESGIAGQYGKIESQAIPLEFQQGHEQALARQYAGQEAAAQGAVTQLQTALGQAVTERGQTLTGLGAAAGYAQPSVAAYGQTVFNPLTGQYEGGGGLPADTLQQYAQMAASGQYAAIPSAITSNPVLSAQLNAAAKQLNPNYNPIASTAQGQAAATNIQTGGTATPSAYNAIYQQALGDYTNLQQSVQNVDQFGSLLTSNMAAGGINPTDVKYANKTLAQIRAQLSSGAQAQYDTTLAALRSKISGMLSIGGTETPTAITADAQKILDGSLPLSSLNDVLGRIQQEGNVLLQNQAQKVNTAKTGTLGGGSTGNASGSAITWDSILSQ